MARKVRKSGSKNKASGHTSYRDRAAKDEKARYERCRRRRLGLVKKLAEFHTLFDTEVQCLFRSKTDKRQVYWFSSEDDWRDQAPQTTVSIRTNLAIRLFAHQCSSQEPSGFPDPVIEGANATTS